MHLISVGDLSVLHALSGPDFGPEKFVVVVEEGSVTPDFASFFLALIYTFHGNITLPIVGYIWRLYLRELYMIGLYTQCTYFYIQTA